MGDDPAERTPLHYPDALDALHAKQNLREILLPENVHVGQFHEALIDGDRVGDHVGSLLCWS